MTSIAHHFEFSDLPILSHQLPRVTANSAGIPITSTFTDFTHSNSARRPPLLPISQLQPFHSTAIPSNSFVSSTEFRPSEIICKPLPSTREMRRKVRSVRSGSPSGTPSVPSLRSRKLQSSHRTDAQHQDQIRSDGDDEFDFEPPLPYQRLALTRSKAPSTPPVIPDHIIIPKAHCDYPHTPLVKPAYEIPHETPKDTYTCVRAKINPHSVSICTQTPVHLCKTVNKLKRVKKVNSPSSPGYNQSSSMKMKISLEQEKWWSWSIICPFTSDANKSSHYAPLRCKDLKRKLDVYEDSKETKFEIQTKPISRFSLGLEKFHYSA